MWSCRIAISTSRLCENISPIFFTRIHAKLFLRFLAKWVGPTLEDKLNASLQSEGTTKASNKNIIVRKKKLNVLLVTKVTYAPSCEAAGLHFQHPASRVRIFLMHSLLALNFFLVCILAKLICIKNFLTLRYNLFLKFLIFDVRRMLSYNVYLTLDTTFYFLKAKIHYNLFNLLIIIIDP